MLIVNYNNNGTATQPEFQVQIVVAIFAQRTKNGFQPDRSLINQ